LKRAHWEVLFKTQFPAFYDCLCYHRAKSWRNQYRDTSSGRCCCILEVFNRDKHVGFAMSATAACVQYEAKFDCYRALYLSAQERHSERIPRSESNRLRFCSPSVRAELQPGCSHPGVGSPYPYRVLRGTSGLKVGKGVELQWKMQVGSPFGWWYGMLESLDQDAERQQAVATITFEHFPCTSLWYRLEVQVGDGKVRQCSIGGFTGGIRGVNSDEQQQWKRFFPERPMVF